MLIARPVARATAAIPPQPIASASAPAHKRRARSSIVAVSRRHFRRTSFSASTANVDHVSAILSIPNRPRSIDLFKRGPLALIARSDIGDVHAQLERKQGVEHAYDYMVRD